MVVFVVAMVRMICAGPGAGSLVDNETGLVADGDGDGDENSNDLFLLRLQSTTTMVTFQTVLARLLSDYIHSVFLHGK